MSNLDIYPTGLDNQLVAESDFAEGVNNRVNDRPYRRLKEYVGDQLQWYTH